MSLTNALRTASIVLLLTSATAFGQMSAAEHASHHPAASAPDQTAQPGAAMPVAPGFTPNAPATGLPPDSAVSPGSPAAGAGGMMSGAMSKMMQPGCCGANSNNPLFPALMALPPLSPAERARVENMAHQRMNEGTDTLSHGLEELAAATAVNNYPAMESASAHMREGTDAFQSGLAARRALGENQNPQVVALQWFRQQLTLPDEDAGRSTISPFHWLVMVALFAFVGVMLWMYLHKMRRADALIAGLAAGTPLPSTPATKLPEGAPATSPSAGPSKPNSWTGKLRVARIFQETPNVKTFRLVNPEGDPLPFVYLPGQFLTVTVAPKGNRTKRSYTISSSPTQSEYCEATVKHEEHGVVSSYLIEQVHEGDLLEVTAPSGKFTFTGKESGSVLFLAGGVGVTPFMASIRYLTALGWNGDMYLVYACKSPENIIFREDLEYLERKFPNVHVTYVVDDGGSGWKGKTGRITKQLLQEVVPDIAKRHVHICGPNPFMDAMKGVLGEAGVPAEEIMTEVFAGKLPVPPTPETKGPDAPPTPPPDPENAGGNDKVPQAAAAPAVTFTKAGKSAPLPPDKSVLEASEDIGVNIDYSCRVGTCGVCKVKLISGNVTMAVQDALEPADKAQNIILACQAKSTADVSVEA
ncbi:FAD-binding oxidoreductase [soil metagenome]